MIYRLNKLSSRKIKSALVQFGLCFSVFVVVFIYYQKLDNSSMDAYNHLIKARYELNLEASNYERLDTSLKIWKADELLRNSDFKGVEISSMDSLIKKLASKHRVADIKVSLSVPEIRKDSFNNKYVFISYSRGTLDFYAVTDDEAYEFIDDFANNVEGYLQIVFFDIAKGKVIAPNARNFKVRVRFIWQDLVDKSYVAKS